MLVSTFVLFVLFVTAQATCPAPPGAQFVYDACGTEDLGGINTTLTALLNSTGTSSTSNVQSLLQVAYSLAGAAFYSGGFVSAVETPYTISELMTADVWLPELPSTANPWSVDIGQILASGLFGTSAFSGYYPDASQSYLLTTVQLLVDIGSALMTTNALLSDINASLAPARLPNRVAANGTVLTYTTISAAQILADTLYLRDVGLVYGGGNSIAITYTPISKLVGVPWFDPDTYSLSTLFSPCNITPGSDTTILPNINNQQSLASSSMVNSYGVATGISSLTSLPSTSFMGCISGLSVTDNGNLPNYYAGSNVGNTHGVLHTNLI